MLLYISSVIKNKTKQKTNLGFSLQWNLLDDANHIDVLQLLTPIDWE